MHYSAKCRSLGRFAIGIRPGSKSHGIVGVIIESYYTLNKGFHNYAYVLLCPEDGKRHSFQQVHILPQKPGAITWAEKARKKYIGCKPQETKGMLNLSKKIKYYRVSYYQEKSIMSGREIDLLRCSGARVKVLRRAKPEEVVVAKAEREVILKAWSDDEYEPF